MNLPDCTFNPPSLQAWTYLVAVQACIIFGSIPLGIILYSAMATNVRKPLGAFIGIIAAAAVPLGKSCVEIFSPDDSITWTGLFLASVFGWSIFFKSFNAAFGNYPEGADRDLRTWLIWFTMIPEPEFTKGKLSKSSMKDILKIIRSFLYKIMGLFIVLSIVLHSPDYNLHFSQIPDLLSTHINGYLHIWLFYLFVSFCTDFSVLASIGTTGGIRMEPGFLNPLLESRCLKEVWGSRWNLPVHTLLKRTIYIPARKQGVSKGVSTFLTFVGSGLMHEYNFSIHNHSVYEPFEAMTFFGVMGLLMMIESWIWRQCPLQVQRTIDNLPSVVTSIGLTFLVAGAFERYFNRGFFEAGFIDATAQMLPHLSCG